MKKPSEQASADAVVFKKGAPSLGPKDTRERERDKAEALEGVAHGVTLPLAEDVPVGAPGCQCCEVLPQPFEGPGVLELRFGHTHTLGKVLVLLADSHWEHVEQGGTVRVRVPESLAPLLAPIMDRLSWPEKRDARARFLPEGLAQGGPFDVEALPALAAKVRVDWLLRILREDRLRAVFQPILSTKGANGEVHGYECLLRGDVDGEAVGAGPMLEMARGAELLFQFDLAARRAALLGAAEHRIKEKIFVNFAPNAIYNPYSCLDSTVRLVDKLKIARERVVFEIIESERLPEPAHLKNIATYYREHGFGVALDDVGAGFSSLSLLTLLKPDYVKLDMSLIRNVDEDPARALVARKLLETARELGLKTVAEGVESPGEYAWLREHGADFVQGYLFARPAAPPPSVQRVSKEGGVGVSRP